MIAAVLVLGCSRRQVESPGDPDQETPTHAIVAASEPELSRRNACTSATCLTAYAAERERSGVHDVAATQRGRAYERDPSELRLRAWLDVLEKSGQHRRLDAAIKVGASKYPRVVAGYDAKPGPNRSTRPGPASPALRTALELERNGELQAAVERLVGIDDVGARTRRADLLTSIGEHAAAAEQYARARVELDERGGAMRLAPFHRWYMSGLAWSDGHPVRLGDWRPMSHAERSEVGEIQHWSAADFEPQQTFVLPRGSGTLVHDGRVYALGEHGLEIRSIRSGRPLGHLALDVKDATGFTVVQDATQAYLALMYVGRIDLFEFPDDVATGELERNRSHRFRGTTPTITRAYTGEGSYHHNILDDVQSWVVSTAMSADGQWFAVGTSDSVVHLYAGDDQKSRRLQYDWTYEERRPMGGNPDLNPALDLGFDGDELVAAYEHGDVIRWDVTKAKAARHHRSPCPKNADSFDCGGFTLAALSFDTSKLATIGMEGLRVRDTTTGKQVALGNSDRFIPQYLTWTPDDAVLVGDIYGNVWRWTEGERARQVGKKHTSHEGGPRTVQLSDDGRYLSWGGSYTPLVVWDLYERRRVPVNIPDDLDVQLRSGNGKRVVATGPDGLDEVRTTHGDLVFPKNGPAFEGKIRFADEAGRYAVIGNAGSNGVVTETFIDLDTGRTQVLEPGRTTPGPHRVYATSDDGRTLARFGEDAIHVHDTATGALEHEIESSSGSYRGTKGIGFALSPTGTWVAWIEQNEQANTHALPHCTVHLIGLANDVRDRKAQVVGWNKQLIPSRDGKEILVATENRMARFDVKTGVVTPEPLEYVSANTIHLSTEGDLVVFEAYDRVELRDNVHGLPVLATIYALDDDGWLVQTASGAVDGSHSARQFLATIVDGPEDESVFPGTLGWDRFAVPELLFTEGGLRLPPPGVDVGN